MTERLLIMPEALFYDQESLRSVFCQYSQLLSSVVTASLCCRITEAIRLRNLCIHFQVTRVLAT